MASIGYFLSCEQFGPQELVDQARRAEQAGFERLWISDHFHPWNDEQGQSPFVWGVIGALSQVTSLPVTTAVTCPTVRIHPAIIAQAAATAAVQLDGRFVLGVGSGEALNEHVLGDPWPSVGVRLEMLEEAVDVIRLLHQGDEVSHHGIVLRGAGRPDLHPARAAGADLRLGVRAAGRRAGRPDRRRHVHDDARRRPDQDVPGVRRRRQAGAGRAPRSAGAGTPTRRSPRRTGCGRTRACPASSPRPCRGRRTSKTRCRWCRRRRSRESVTCGPDVDKHVAQLREYVDAGADEVYVAADRARLRRVLHRVREGRPSGAALTGVGAGYAAVTAITWDYVSVGGVLDHQRPHRPGSTRADQAPRARPREHRPCSRPAATRETDS